jgi:hypothetical protein
MLALFFFGFCLVPGEAVVSTVPPSGAVGASAGVASVDGTSAGTSSSWKTSFSAAGRFTVVVRSNSILRTELFPAPMDFPANQKKNIKLLN